MLSRPDLGHQMSVAVDLNTDPAVLGTGLLRLDNLTENWDSEEWYERTDIPPYTEPLRKVEALDARHP